MKKNIYKKYLWLPLIVVVAIILYKHYNQPTYRFSEGIVWTTEFHIAYESDKDLDDSIQVALMQVDNSLSQFNKKSLVTKINQNMTDSTDFMFEAVYATSKRVSEETAGAFDPTCAPLVNAWGFGYKNGALPDSTQIDSILKFVGIEKTMLTADKKIKKSDSRTSFDFSAIAKGYGCDAVGRMLERNGVKNYMVEIGGEIALLGVNKQGEAWHISVDKPIENNDSVIHQSSLILMANSGGIATSGNYRNYKIVNGKKVAHTINPKKGYPEISNLLSVTIVAPSCMEADAYATACMVMGLNRTKQFMKNNDKLGVYLVSVDKNGKNEPWMNSKFKKMVVE